MYDVRKDMSLTQSTITLITIFNEGYDYLRITPRKKNVVSIVKNICAQTRLLLRNLRELQFPLK